MWGIEVNVCMVPATYLEQASPLRHELSNPTLNCIVGPLARAAACAGMVSSQHAARASILLASIWQTGLHKCLP